MPSCRTALLSALAVVTLSVSASTGRAQGQVGVIVGATFSTLRGIDDLDSRTGLVGGLSIVLPAAGPIALQPELLFVSKGAKGTNNGPDGIKLSYVEIPVLLRLSLGGTGPLKPHVYAGPYLGLQINCTVQGTSSDCDDLPGLSTKTVDIGATIGGGLDFGLGPAVVTGGLRYGFGISTVAEFEVGNVRESAQNGVFAVYAGLALRSSR
jgi:hypothetical protein